MTTSRKPYSPSRIAAKGKRTGTETFSRLARRRWPFSNLGTWVVRDIRDKPGIMSQHAAGLALDLGYTDRAAALEACTWFVKWADELGVALINDYTHGKYGRTWLCSRAAWKVHDKPTIGSRGAWIHVELHAWAANHEGYEALWRAIPKP